MTDLVDWPEFIKECRIQLHFDILSHGDQIKILERLDRFERQELVNYRFTLNGCYGLAGEVIEFPLPIPMLLICPCCHDQHIDEGVWATKPHKTHQCQTCCHEWKPANVPTAGVNKL